MKVGIRFWDNDYYNELRDFFQLFILPEFIEREEGHMVTHLTSSMIVDLFNSRMPYINRLNDYHNGRCAIDAPLSDYFHITEAYVYWDDRTDGFVPEWHNNGCEFVWTDGKRVY